MKFIAAGIIALTLAVANALFGGSASERAIRAFDQSLIDAWAADHGADPAQVPRVDGFSVERRVPILVFTYYYGQSLVNGRDISCASRHSVVIWYGLGASLIWQDGRLFPSA